jgi:hypothetical protein
MLFALVAGGTLAIAQSRLTRAVDALAALGRPLDDVERRLVLDAVTATRDVLDWVAALADGDPRADGLGHLPGVRRVRPGPIEPTMTPLVDARYRLKQAGRFLAELAEQGRRPDGDSRDMLLGLTASIATSLDWITVLAQGAGVTDTALAALLD